VEDTEMPEPTRVTVIAVRDDFWDTLSETLALDAESGAFAPELREQIAEALGGVVHITDEVSELFRAFPREGVFIGEQIAALESAVRGAASADSDEP
jgi:uncharacterized protein involved in exopolysaccharide biosynthesis